mmetsp:Transcript_2552/g.7946  ORF Transcript_2552/g.7946 Transcript_2552/m.7946 type:complete len:203 (-) Transcript_2552:30-638(-)
MRFWQARPPRPAVSARSTALRLRRGRRGASAALSTAAPSGAPRRTRSLSRPTASTAGSGAASPPSCPAGPTRQFATAGRALTTSGASRPRPPRAARSSASARPPALPCCPPICLRWRDASPLASMCIRQSNLEEGGVDMGVDEPMCAVLLPHPPARHSIGACVCIHAPIEIMVATRMCVHTAFGARWSGDLGEGCGGFSLHV